MTNLSSINQLETKKIQDVLEKATVSGSFQLTSPDIQELTESQIKNYKALLTLTDEINEASTEKLHEMETISERMADIKKRLSQLRENLQSALPQEVTGHYSMTQGL